jgi:FtsH-binding integral membrane protein
MTIASLICFGLAALCGITLLVFVFYTHKTPKAITLLHGAFAISGLILLAIATVYHQEVKFYPVVSIFIIVALVGLYMFARDMKKPSTPKHLVIIHATITMFGFLILVYVVFL